MAPGLRCGHDPGDSGPPPDYVNPQLPSQAEMDTNADPDRGGWPQATESGGSANRPVVVAFSVDGSSKLGEGVTRTAIPDVGENWSGGWRVVVTPYNVCGASQAPASDGCYLSPNRIGVTVAYDPGSGLLYNFAGSSLAEAGVTPDTEFGITLDLQGYFGPKVGWTWMNGEPTFWKVDGNILQIGGKPRFMPSSQDVDPGCTRLPIEGCPTVQPQAEHLTFTMVISMDGTGLPDVFGGTLFATSGAMIGSLDVVGTFNPSLPWTNALGYSLAAPHQFAADYPDLATGGAVRSGTFFAVVPDEVLTSAFGIVDPSAADLSVLLAVTRSRDRVTKAGVDVVTWTPKTVESFGTPSHLLKIENVSFSAPTFRLKRTAAVRKGRYASAYRVRDNVGVPRPTARQRISVSIATGSRSVCRYVPRTGQIRGLAPGVCRYTVRLVNRRNGATVLRKSGLLRVIR